MARSRDRAERPPHGTLRDRILALDAEITALDQTIATREADLNTLIYKLYHLSPEEIAMVERG